MPKETSHDSHQHHSPAGHASQRPHAHWQLPEGWVEKEQTSMRVGNFAIPGKDGQQAEVSIIPLPGFSGSILDNVNLWMSQLKLPAMTQEEMDLKKETAKIGTSDKAQLYDLVSVELMVDDKSRSRILGAIFPQGQVTWYVKMFGEDSLVSSQKETFIRFLETLSFHHSDEHHRTGETASSPVAETAPAPATQAAPTPTGWSTPAGWTQQAPSGMRAASYLVEDASGDKVDVSVVALDGGGGGDLNNINRWRGQIGLANIQQDTLAAHTASIEVGGVKSLVVDMTGTDPATQKPVRVVGIIVPKGAKTWYFKMTGDGRLVEREKAALIQLAQKSPLTND